LRCGAVPPACSAHSARQILLAIGNYLNGSTFRGGAWGFKLDVLTKVRSPSVRPRRSDVVRAQLAETKSSNPRVTLLNYLADFVEQKYPEAHEFTKDLQSAADAARGAHGGCGDPLCLMRPQSTCRPWCSRSRTSPSASHRWMRR
jgi:hypothetical protein